jgi:hypothetical protein
MADGANNQLVGVKCQRIPLIACVCSFTIFGKPPEGDLKMPSVIKYSLFVLADVAIIGCIVHFGYSTLTPRASIALEEFMARSSRPGSTRIDQLKGGSYLLAVFISLALAMYGSLRFLFAWTPNAGELSAFTAFMGTIASMGFVLTNTKADLYRSQLREAKEEAFKKLIRTALTGIGPIARHPELEANRLASLKCEIDEAEKSRTIYEEDAALCRYLLNVFEAASRDHSARRDNLLGRLYAQKSPPVEETERLRNEVRRISSSKDVSAEEVQRLGRDVSRSFVKTTVECFTNEDGTIDNGAVLAFLETWEDSGHVNLAPVVRALKANPQITLAELLATLDANGPQPAERRNT